MPKVKVLDKELSELIAAGEVIERPSSIIKELLENSIDSGATAITAEIKQGGISYIRVTDNGCGISYSDVPTAFLRHATSKLSAREDLNRIHTLGFRGEALASISAVARCEIMTKPKEEDFGTRYRIEGTEEKLYEKTGCPDGTTIVIRDIFYNVPARLKFLKKDKYEGNAIASIIGKIAVSHPGISFTFIRDNRRELFTPGDGSLYSTVYSSLGREFAASMIPVDYSLGGIKVNGFTVKPLFGRRNRAMQHFFVNGRYVKSFTCMGALEEAYRNNLMEGKFPACVLFMEIPPMLVDVNVHPAKIEVRFSDDKLVYDAIFFAVKNAILCDGAAAEMKLPGADQGHKKTEADYALSPFQNPATAVQTSFDDTSVSRFSGSVKAVRAADDPANERSVFSGSVRRNASGSLDDIIGDLRQAFPGDMGNIPPAPVQDIPYKADNIPDEPRGERPGSKAVTPHDRTEISPVQTRPPQRHDTTETVSPRPDIPEDISEHLQQGDDDSGIFGLASADFAAAQKREFKYINAAPEDSGQRENIPRENAGAEETEYFRFLGEVFKNYIIAETGDGILIVDKHAAHERIRFERLRTGRENLTAQMLLAPVKLRLDYSEYDALMKNLRVCADCGFDIEPLAAPEVLIKGIPSMLDKRDAEEIVTELAVNFAAHRHDPLPEILDDMYHTMACRGAIKANDITSPDELTDLLRQVLSDERIRYCPHGRPVMFKLTKREIEKQFRRIV